MSGAQEELQPDPPPTPAPQSQERLTSGVKGLDEILHGGFLKGDSYIVLGAPGSGKTILSHQVAFNHIANGGRVIFLTVLTEAHDRMIAHMRSLSFFDFNAVNESLFYISGYSVLENEGLKGLLGLIRDVIRQYKATLFILDGLATVEDFASSNLDFKSFIKSMDLYSEVNGCTMLLLTHRGNGAFLQAEHTMVDGLIELTYDLANVRSQRFIHIPKFRGSAYLEGLHSLLITSDGVAVHPRLEALLAETSYSTHGDIRVPFDIPQLNEMLGGGLIKGSSTMLLGPTGSGKTLTGLSFLAAGLERGEACLYFGFFESPDALVQKGERTGLRLEKHRESGLLKILWQPPLEWDIDALAGQFLEILAAHKVQRVFIDALGPFYNTLANPERLLRFWAALGNELRARNVTMIYSQELNVIFGGAIELPIQGLSAVADNLILLRLNELHSEMRHLISIIKLRDSGFDQAVRVFTISNKGIMIGKQFDDNGGSTLASPGEEIILLPDDSETKDRPGQDVEPVFKPGGTGQAPKVKRKR